MELTKGQKMLITNMINHELKHMDSTVYCYNELTELKQALNIDGVISRLSMQEVLNYEIHSHWLASWIGFEWGQDLMGKYFAWKVRRKYNRYLVSLEESKRVLNGL